MISPRELEVYANEHREENMAFRLFLKEHADSETLDAQFLNYHKQYFEQYNCKECLNCCTQLSPLFEGKELEALAQAGNLYVEDILEVCEQVDYDSYEVIEGEKCPFLTEEGCSISKNKPENCKDFPYTNQENRLGSMLGILSNLAICPVLYEIYDQLKKDYGFTYKG